MEIVIVCVVAGASLALWVVLYRRVTGIPSIVWQIVRQERAAEAEKAMGALREAAAGKVGAIIQPLRDHELRLAESYRGLVAEAEARARMTDRRASDAGVALSAASELVRELRVLVDERRAEVAVAGEVDQRETTEIAKPAPEAVETTRKLERAAPASRERSSPRQAAPGLDPPGSAVPLPSEPAMKAAGLGRPRPTLLGLKPPPLRAPDAEDDGDSDDEVTRMGPRPPKSALAMTLPSMAAVAQPSADKGGGS